MVWLGLEAWEIFLLEGDAGELDFYEFFPGTKTEISCIFMKIMFTSYSFNMDHTRLKLHNHKRH